MTHYVAGFLFDDALSRVALIRKLKPEWQAGRLNGIGGKIEPGETPADAMRREFCEEAGPAGLWVHYWHHFATVQGAWGSVAFFRSTGPVEDVRSMELEQVEVHNVADLPWAECLPNLSWLIPLARYTHDWYAPVVAEEVER